MSHTTANPDTTMARAPVAAGLQRTGKSFSRLQMVVVLSSILPLCLPAPAPAYLAIPSRLLQCGEARSMGRRSTEDLLKSHGWLKVIAFIINIPVFIVSQMPTQ